MPYDSVLIDRWRRISQRRIRLALRRMTKQVRNARAADPRAEDRLPGTRSRHPITEDKLYAQTSRS